MMRKIAIIPSSQISDYKFLHTTESRVVKLLTRSNKFECIIVNWYDFKLSNNSVLIDKAGILKGQEFTTISFANPVTPDFVFFHPTSNKEQVKKTSQSLRAFKKLLYLNALPTENPTYNQLCYSLLTQISKRSIPVSHNQDAELWGIKSIFEKRCIEYQQASGEYLPRPKTEIIKHPLEKHILILMLKKHQFCIIKPNLGSRGEGIIIMNSSYIDIIDNYLSNGDYIIQELIPDPLVYKEKKVDLRAYLIISDLNQKKYLIPSLIIVRSARHNYQCGRIDSEICNTSLSNKLDLEDSVYLFEDLLKNKESGIDWQKILSRVKEVLSSFMNAVTWRASNFNNPPSIMLWGIDLLVTKKESGYEVLLLEMNHSPLLFRGNVQVDKMMERLLINDFFPMVNKN